MSRQLRWILLIFMVTVLLAGCATKATIQGIVPVDGQNKLQVHFIDVGQGSSQLLIGPTGKTMLIDAGNNDQEKVVVAYLKQQQISKLDIVVGSHPDADHVGGLDAVIDSFEVGQVYMPRIQANTKTFEDVLLAIQRKGLKVQTAKAGVTLEWEPDTTVKMVAPVGQYDDTNEMSAVLHVSYGNTSFLLTADAEQRSEQDMLDSKVNLKADVLMVGHHGSKTSTSELFLAAVQPTYAVIQVGKDNKYGHPAREIIDRLEARGIQVYRNDVQGSVIMTSDGTTIAMSTIPTTEPSTEAASVEPSIVYNSCAEVRKAGKAPLYRGDPGYSTKLDRDQDGIACE